MAKFSLTLWRRVVAMEMYVSRTEECKSVAYTSEDCSVSLAC